MPKLGVDNDRLTPCPNKPNCVSSQADDKEHFIEPILLPVSSDNTRQMILAVLDDLSRVVISVKSENYIHVEFTSLIFRFVDDVEFYITENRSGNTRVDIRSASRVGTSDFGVNRKRMEIIRQKIEQMSDETTGR